MFQVVRALHFGLRSLRLYRQWYSRSRDACSAGLPCEPLRCVVMVPQPGHAYTISAAGSSAGHAAWAQGMQMAASDTATAFAYVPTAVPSAPAAPVDRTAAGGYHGMSASIAATTLGQALVLVVQMAPLPNIPDQVGVAEVSPIVDRTGMPVFCCARHKRLTPTLGSPGVRRAFQGLTLQNMTTATFEALAGPGGLRQCPR